MSELKVIKLYGVTQIRPLLKSVPFPLQYRDVDQWEPFWLGSFQTILAQCFSTCPTMIM